MNEEQRQLSEKEIKDAKAKQAGKDVADIAGRVASTYFGGAAGAKAYDIASKTKLGQAVLDRAGNKITKNPMTKNVLAKNQETISQAKPLAEQAMGGLDKTGGSSDNSKTSNSLKKPNKIINNLQTSDSSSGNIAETVNKIKKYWPIITIVAQILLGFIIIFLVVAILMSGIMNIKDTFTNLDEKFLNFVSGCGWSDKAQCNANLANNFYEEVNEQYDRVKTEHGLLINRELIVATLTYDNPFFNYDNKDGGVNYRKSKRKVKELVNEMVVKVTQYYKKNKADGTLTLVYEGYELSDAEKGTYEIVEMENYILDYENYRKYLEDKFIIDFYLNNNKSAENKIKAKEIVEEIYSRVELAVGLENEFASANMFKVQNVTVTITDSNGIAIEQTTLYDYLLGVVYMYADNNSTEYLNYLAVAAKNYLYSINGAKVDSMPTTLRIRNSDANQLYCNVKEGCHYRADGTLAIGPDKDDNYSKGPAPAVFITIAGQVIDSKMNEFLITDGTIVNTKLTIGDTSILSNLNGTDYKTLLNQNYGGSISNVSVVTSGYPLDSQYNRVTSLYGWRIHPIQQICKHHNGMDIDAPADAPIYAFANGVVVVNQFNASYGNFTVIGHGGYNSSTGTYEYYTLYAHQIRLSSYISVGSEVVVGQRIGSVGTTGSSTGNHLHFEIYKLINGQKVASNPALSFTGMEFRGLDVNAPLYPNEAACLSVNRR